jgi:hypothetical protein
MVNLGLKRVGSSKGEMVALQKQLEIPTEAAFPLTNEAEMNRLRSEATPFFLDSLVDVFKFRSKYLSPLWEWSESGLTFKSLGREGDVGDGEIYSVSFSGDGARRDYVLHPSKLPRYEFLRNKQGVTSALMLTQGSNDRTPTYGRDVSVFKNVRQR